MVLAGALVAPGCGGGDGGPGDDDATPAADDDAADDDSGPDAPPRLEFDPSRPGPFPVGNLTREFRDRSRWDMATRSERRLLVEVWYPAVETGPEVPEQHVRDFLGGWDEFIAGVLSWLVDPADMANFDQPVRSRRAVPPDRSRGPYPVVFFSHGNGGVRFQNWTMAEYLAGHGYVVVAPDHTGNAAFVPFADKVVVFNPLMMPVAFVDRWKDMVFLLDRMEELTADDPEGWLTGMIDPARAAIVGHSFGGATVGEVLRQDGRFTAGLLIAGPAMPWTSEAYDAAVFHVYNGEDNTMRDTQFLMDWSYETAPPPKYRIDCPDAGHYTFTDACRLIPSLMGDGDGCGTGERHDGGEPFAFIDYDRAQAILDSYLTAFLGASLSGYVPHAQYLWTNHFPEDIRYQYALP
jgi:dienelactone hydrolase